MIDKHDIEMYVGRTRRAAGIAVAIAVAVTGMFLVAARADAHPYDAPQIGDVAEFDYRAADCHNGFTSVVGRNTSDRTATFALERKFDDAWLPASAGNDGARAYISSKLYEGRAVVTVRSGELFEIEHHQPRGDTAEYRWISMWTGGPTDRAVLAQWTSHRPLGTCRQLQ